MSETHRAIPLGVKPLTSHTTPYTLSRLQTVPPMYRKKSNWYREKMDTLVDNDTQDLHWHLSSPESRRLLEAIFPDHMLFPHTSKCSSMTHLLDSFRGQGIYKRNNQRKPIEQWQQFPSCQGKNAEKDMAGKWHADGATAPLKGSDANRKPDFILLPLSIADSSRELDWRDVIVFREMKSRKTTDTLRKSYIEGAGKTALLLYAQDGRHSAPYLQMLGHYMVLTFFDRGGSLSTAVFDIHDNPDVFLHILLGISTAPTETIGFDETVFWDRDDKKKKVLVAWKGSSSEDDKGNPTVSLEQLIFISDTLHSRGTTVWAGSMKDPTSPMARRQIVVKDSWIDPLRKFTEGSMLAKLNDVNVKGVPQLIHEQQVQGPHPSHAEMKVNMSMHFLRRLVSQSGGRQYQLRVLFCLLTEPLGIQIMAFSSLAQLLIAFLDYVQIHKDAIVKAKVLHRDISWLNLLLVVWDASRGDSHCLDFLDHLLPETHEHLQAKIQEIPYRGFLTDWGYAVPIDVPQTEAYTTPEPEGPSTSPSTPHHDAPPTSPISPPNTSTSVDNSVPVRIPVPKTPCLISPNHRLTQTPSTAP
ncbi:hypothetical protein EDD15DRAFT_2199193 [Pisolithus albus]|nr:hypothetical protein EDD15DRAFT_2199193 [Pisolithus albus]